jgi:UDP-N-acetylmuramoyl-tripeptide--D-alanyl-D-alanine ligase
MGMNHFGEIAYLTQLTKPHVAIINNAAQSHLEGTGGNIAGVAKAKGEIFLGLQKNGVAVLNKDDAFYDYWYGLTKDYKRITFGLENSADVSAQILQQTANHQTISIDCPLGKIEVSLPLLGKHNVMNALAACAGALALDIDISAIKTGLETVEAAKGRLNHHLLPNDVRIIDDTYNANPFSLDAAIEVLSFFEGTKILVLADMKELGPDAQTYHREAGKKALSAGIDLLFTFGELSKLSSESFGPKALHFTDRNQLIAALKPYLNVPTTILVKGSNSMKMDKVVTELIAISPCPATH